MQFVVNSLFVLFVYNKIDVAVRTVIEHRAAQDAAEKQLLVDALQELEKKTSELKELEQELAKEKAMASSSLHCRNNRFRT
jgi:radical SAM superfamily enzyme